MSYLEGTLFELMELDVMVVNAAHMKAVPGRKTDVKDAEWIAELLRHGLLEAGFIPSREQKGLFIATKPHLFSPGFHLPAQHSRQRVPPGPAVC